MRNKEIVANLSKIKSFAAKLKRTEAAYKKASVEALRLDQLRSQLDLDLKQLLDVCCVHRGVAISKALNGRGFMATDLKITRIAQPIPDPEGKRRWCVLYKHDYLTAASWSRSYPTKKAAIEACLDYVAKKIVPK